MFNFHEVRAILMKAQSNNKVKTIVTRKRIKLDLKDPKKGTW